MRFKIIIPILLAGLMLIGATMGAWAGSATPSGGDSTTPLKGPTTSLSETHYKFQPLFEGEDVKHDFIIENKGDAPLVIKNIKPG